MGIVRTLKTERKGTGYCTSICLGLEDVKAQMYGYEDKRNFMNYDLCKYSVEQLCKYIITLNIQVLFTKFWDTFSCGVKK